MKSMKSLSMNKMLGGIKRKSTRTPDHCHREVETAPNADLLLQ